MVVEEQIHSWELCLEDAESRSGEEYSLLVGFHNVYPRVCPAHSLQAVAGQEHPSGAG